MAIIAVTGANGFVGSHLTASFRSAGHNVISIDRSDFKAGPELLSNKLQGSDIVVNLAGAPVIKRWTDAYMKTMYESRVDLTRALVKAMGLMERKPSLFISTSAVGYYSSKGSHDEYDNQQSDDFLGIMAGDWEREALAARDHGIRTVIFRFGIVLGSDGGALKQMLTPFRMGLGGTIGNGRQAFSWIHIDDLVRAYELVMDNSSMAGIYNLCAPEPATNKELTKTLSNTLQKPAVMRVPALALRLQYGRGAEVLTKGQSVYPKRLMESGFTYKFSSLDEAIKDCVN